MNRTKNIFSQIFLKSYLFFFIFLILFIEIVHSISVFAAAEDLLDENDRPLLDRQTAAITPSFREQLQEFLSIIIIPGLVLFGSLFVFSALKIKFIKKQNREISIWIKILYGISLTLVILFALLLFFYQVSFQDICPYYGLAIVMALCLVSGLRIVMLRRNKIEISKGLRFFFRIVSVILIVSSLYSAWFEIRFGDSSLGCNSEFPSMKSNPLFPFRH